MSLQNTLLMTRQVLCLLVEHPEEWNSRIPLCFHARLSYAGKKLVDASRTLEHYGVDYWHARFPNWPLVICAP